MQQYVDHSAVKAILNVLRRKIARRTSESEAASMLSRFIKELTPKYKFLKYISINQAVYSETETIWVAPELNQINQKEIFSALHELVKLSVREMKEKADFFFIREFQDAFDDLESVHTTVTDDIPLDEMQHEYLINRTHTLSFEKNQLLINLIHALLSIANKYLSEKESVQLVEASLLELLPKFPFFHSVDIVKNVESKGYYTVEITGNIQKIPTYQFADSLYQLIVNIGSKLNIENAEDFRSNLKRKLGQRNTDLLHKLSVPIDNLYVSTSSVLKKDLMTGLIDALVDIVGNRTSQLFAVAVMIKMTNVVKENNPLFETINLTKEGDSYSLSFEKNIERVVDEEFRKAIKALIEAVGKHLGNKKGSFINELKEKLGKEYVSSIENMGLNFHILEMRFN
ncbi:MAG: hypothetical protein KGY50_02630 [Candidatus Thermoplasmatota archaeon]|nr:hypothetical protein [Candidatus Thermoplasmatota archaeon]